MRRLLQARSPGKWAPTPELFFASFSLLVALLTGAEAKAQLSSYPTSASDIVGSTGAAAVALGVPDYAFVNDAALPFGGMSTDVFDVGEVVELVFPTSLQNHPAQQDLIVSAYVGGLGETDNARVQVEGSSDGSNFTILRTFDTEIARSLPPPDQWEIDYPAVKQFGVEFGALDHVTHIRLTNLSGTSEGLRLDAVEGLHPLVHGTHAFEIRWERVRQDSATRFRPRIKNIADPGGVPIREWIMDRPETFERLEDTYLRLDSADGFMICVEHCITDNTPERIPYSRHVWSVDGVTEAPVGVGLEPGRQLTLPRYNAFDTDSHPVAYLSGFAFTIVFADGFAHTFSWDEHAMKEIGSLYQQYQYFSPTPILTIPRPVDYYQFVSAGPPAIPVPSMSKPALWMLVAVVVGFAGIMLRRRFPRTAG